LTSGSLWCTISKASGPPPYSTVVRVLYWGHGWVRETGETGKGGWFMSSAIDIGNCLHCGKPFEKREGGWQKFCNASCRIAHGKCKYSHTCKYCGKDFKSERKESVFCSRQCTQDHERADPTNPPLEKNFHVCEECGKRFYRAADRRKNYRFCCNDCRLEFDKQHAKVHQMLTCQICGKELGVQGGTKGARFCSLTCRRKHWKQQGKHIPQIMECQYCGKEFESTWQGNHKNRYQKFCSIGCRNGWRHTAVPYFPGKIASGHMTNIERIVADELRKRGIPYAFEYLVQPYWLDFLLANKVAIECDGVICGKNLHVHCEHMRWRDDRKDKYLEEKGYRVWRWNDTQIEKDVAELVDGLLEKHPEVMSPTVEEKEYLTSTISNNSSPFRFFYRLRELQGRCKKQDKVFVRELQPSEQTMLRSIVNRNTGKAKLRASIVLMSADGVGVTDIAEECNCSTDAVRAVIKRFNETGIKALRNANLGKKRGPQRHPHAKQRTISQRQGDYHSSTTGNISEGSRTEYTQPALF